MDSDRQDMGQDLRNDIIAIYLGERVASDNDPSRVCIGTVIDVSMDGEMVKIEYSSPPWPRGVSGWSYTAGLIVL